MTEEYTVTYLSVPDSAGSGRIPTDDVEPVKKDSAPKAEPVKTDITPKVKSVKVDSVPKVEPVKVDSAPKVEPVKKDSAPKVEPVKKDSAPKAEPVKVDSAPKVEPVKADSVPKAESLHIARVTLDESAQNDSAPAAETEAIKRTPAPDLTKDDFDYVIPPQRNSRHSSHSSHSSHSKSASQKSGDKPGTRKIPGEGSEGFVFAEPVRKKKRHHRHHRHRKHKFRKLALWKRILIIVGIVLLTLIVALSSTVLILNEIGRRSLLDYDNVEIVTPEDEGIIKMDKNGRVITYDGVSYALNENLISIPVIGVDEGTGADSHLKMADAIYIVTADTKTGKVKILSVSRDTMTDVDVYSEEGKFIDTERLQIAFSYAYGNEKVSGGKNTNTSLSRLFYGLPFGDYFAINMDALVTLNDAIGGVTLTSSMTFVSPVDGRTISEGETVTLHGAEADYYVRYRDKEQLESNNDRMQRQQEYIKAFMESLVPAAQKDISVITQLYEAIQSNSDTTLNLSKLTYIGSTALTKLRSASDIEYVSLKGTITKGEYAEMNVTNDDAIRTMLDVFYTPLAEVPESIR